MPLISASIKQKFKATIYAGLKRNFTASAAQAQGYLPVADEQWMKIADAISDIAMDIVTELTTNAQIVPGQAIAGVGGAIPGPVSGTTVSPGKIV